MTAMRDEEDTRTIQDAARKGLSEIESAPMPKSAKAWEQGTILNAVHADLLRHNKPIQAGQLLDAFAHSLSRPISSADAHKFMAIAALKSDAGRRLTPQRGYLAGKAVIDGRLREEEAVTLAGSLSIAEYSARVFGVTKEATPRCSGCGHMLPQGPSSNGEKDWRTGDELRTILRRLRSQYESDEAERRFASYCHHRKPRMSVGCARRLMTFATLRTPEGKALSPNRGFVAATAVGKGLLTEEAAVAMISNMSVDDFRARVYGIDKRISDSWCPTCGRRVRIPHGRVLQIKNGLESGGKR